jgi:RHS repeat-associated protein
MGGGIGGLLAVAEGGQHYQYLYDGKGNVSAVLDAAAQPVASYRYDAFGKLLAKAGSLEQPFMFSTKRYLEGVGLSYYGYRFYQPVMGRWLTRDPLQEAGGINLYGFVQNNPVNLIDPWGLVAPRGWQLKKPWQDILGGGGGIPYYGSGRKCPSIKSLFRALKGTPAPYLRSSKAGPRLHGKIPHRGDLKKMSKDDLANLRDTIPISLKTRERELRQLGDKGNHGRRIGQERQLLKNVIEELMNRVR